MGARIRSFAAFWYDFVIGDDWLVAAGVVISLALTYALSQTAVPPGGWCRCPWCCCSRSACGARRRRRVPARRKLGARGRPGASNASSAVPPAPRYRLSASSAYTRAA